MELAWLIDLKDESILVIDDDRRVTELQKGDRLPVPNGINLELTVEQIFSWLSL
jgi:hypothetical protein